MLGLFSYIYIYIRMCAYVYVCTNVLVNYSQSAESRATIFSYTANDKPTTGAFKQPEPVLREVTSLARQKLLVISCAIFLYSPLLNKLLLRLFEGELCHDRIIYQHVRRDKGVCTVGIFIVSVTCFRCFVARRGSGRDRYSRSK